MTVMRLSSRFPLPEDAFRLRHRGLLILLAVQIVALPGFGLLEGWSLGAGVLVCAPAAVFGVLAVPARTGRTFRAMCCTLGLLSCSAALVWLWHGQTEAHFHYFVMVGAIALYEAAWPYAIAFAFVILQHGLMSAWMPGRVYGSMVAMAHPWEWACIHGGFVGALALCNLVYWRASSQTREREQAAVAESLQSARRLAHQASHDALTGLLNRRAFVERAQAQLESRRAGRLGVLFVDVDDFKVINDSLGHDAGDALLVAVTERLSRTCPDPVTLIGRFGGDEFVLCLPEVLLDGMRLTADRIRAAFSPPIMLAGVERRVSVSIGLAVAGADEQSIDSLLRDADLAMYEAKAGGKAQSTWFDPWMREQAIDRLELESDLRRAIARGELEAFYQPQVSSHDGRLVGVEALARWRHPERGFVSPASFIPIAERSGLVGDVGAHVLRRACLDAQDWVRRDPRLGGITIAVNASAHCICDEGFPARVASILAQTGMSAQRVCIEVTESAVIENSAASRRVIAQLKALGVRIAIDDFGVGQSSLAQLARLGELDQLKIDKSFIAGIDTNPTACRITGAVIDVALSDGLEVVAEGVEETAQLTMLRRLGCPTIQGFLFSPALPSDELVRWAQTRDVGASPGPHAGASPTASVLARVSTGETVEPPAIV